MKIALPLLILILSSQSLFSQKTTGDAKTGSPCSPAVTGSSNNFYFAYCGSDPEEGKRILRLLTAVAEGQVLTNSKLDQLLDLLNKPTKITMQEVEPAAGPPGSHPRAAVNFYADDPVDRGEFGVVCDRACTPVNICTLNGENSGRFAVIPDHPEITLFLFQRQFPAITWCTLTVESRDDRAVKIVRVEPSNRTTDFLYTPSQPKQLVCASGSCIS